MGFSMYPTLALVRGLIAHLLLHGIESDLLECK
jgi:hypothetical protein